MRVASAVSATHGGRASEVWGDPQSGAAGHRRGRHGAQHAPSETQEQHLVRQAIPDGYSK